MTQQQQQQQQQQQHQQQRLAECLQLSKFGSGRLQLMDSGALKMLCESAAQLLPAWVLNISQNSTEGDASGAQQQLMLLRVLRNACAAGPAAAEVLRTSSVHVHAVQLAAALAQAHARATTVDPQQCKEQQQLLLAALQLLANLCAASAESAAAVWAAFFPDRLQSILAVLQVDVHEVAALTVLYCIRSCSTALADMTSPAAGSIWLHLLAPVLAASSNDTANSSRSTGEPTQHQHQQQHASRIAAPVAAFSTAAPAGDTAGNDNLCLLVKAVALQYDCLQQVMQCLQPSTEAADGNSSAACDTAKSTSSSCGSNCQRWAQEEPAVQPNVCHAVLLHIVEAEVGTIPKAEAAADGKQQGTAAQQEQGQQPPQVLRWLACLVGLVRQLSCQVSSSTAGRGTAAAHVLEAGLQVLRAVLGRDDAGRGLLQYAAAAAARDRDCSGDCVAQLHSLGLVQLVLGMLQQLGLPPKLREQEQQQQQAAGPPPQPPQQPAPQQQPYAGYRADLIALLSNMLYGRRAIQDELLAAGGVEVLLNNCNLDDTAPLAREWALWAVRNMCKDNKAVQQYIAKFQAVEAVQSAELDRMGKELQLDRATNKLSLVDKP